MKTQDIMALSIAAASLLAGDAFAQAVKSTNGLLTDARGRTLYHFTQDAPNKSRCNGPCLLAWPAFIATHGARPTGPFGIIDRVNGDRQWTHKGRPLYFFSGDAHPGDTYGDQLNAQWFVVQTAPTTLEKNHGVCHCVTQMPMRLARQGHCTGSMG